MPSIVQLDACGRRPRPPPCRAFTRAEHPVTRVSAIGHPPVPMHDRQVEVDLHDPPVRLKDLARTGRGLNADLPPDPAPIRVSFSDHQSFRPPPTEVVIWRVELRPGHIGWA
jgi:hypothetical protein